jgi:tetratricopeptide (TPR) repeat protein
MNASATESNGAGTTRWHDSHLNLLLLGTVVVLLLGVPWVLNGNAVFLGELKTQEHVTLKRKSEVDKHFKEGVAMLNSRHYEQAAAAFHRVLALAPEMPEAHVNMGYALLGLGKAAAARDFFDSATVLRPNQMNAYFGLGEALQMLGDNLGALQSMETYLHRAAPDDPFRIKAESAVWELRAEMKGQGHDTPVDMARMAGQAHGRGKK